MKTTANLAQVTAFAATAFSMMLAAPFANADTLHPAELAGIKSVVGAATKITFVNRSTENIRVYWIDYTGTRVLYRTLAPGEEYQLNTYLHHPWVITDDNGNAWTVYYPEAQPRRIEVTRPVAD
jgi:hypothetical protein